MKKITLAPVLRARAWEALKATWPTVLALSCAINLVTSVLSQLVSGLAQPVNLLLSVLITAVAMVPMLGVTQGVLGYYRGQRLTFDCIRGMFPHWRKVICFYLWEMLCIIGWIALGAVPMLLAVLLTGAETSEAMMLLVLILYLASIVLMLVLGFRAVLNYSMANCILADDPAVGARNALRESKAMIRGYRWHYVKVDLPMFLIILAAAIVVGLLSSAVPGWLSTLLNAAVTAVSGMTSYYFLAVMYEELRRIGR